MQRRDFIRLVGGGVVTAALAGCAGAGTDARAAWNGPGAGQADPRKRALAWAILAPNPHNMQPWLADLAEPDAVTLYIDRARLLPVTDPFNRQIVIGCGAFLELLRMAAAREGLAAAIEPFPDGEPRPLLDGRPIARVRFAQGAAPDPLFAQALARRTNRGPFDERPVPEAAARAVADAAGPMAGFTVDPARVAALKTLAFEGARVEAYTPAAHHESVARTFFGARSVAANRYGISLEGPAIEALHASGLLTREKMAAEGTFAFGQSLAFLKKGAETARGFVWLVTPGESRAEELAAGAAYLRSNLMATKLGLSMQPWSQCLQEYETQDDVRAKVHAALAPDGGRVQMFSRIGYARPVPPAPRRGLAAKPQGRMTKAKDRPDVQIFTEIGIIDQLVTARLETSLPRGMSAAQFGVLTHFMRRGGQETPAQLARAFQVTKGAMTNTLQRLQAQGFVAVEPDPRDGRRKLVTMTSAGAAAYEEAIAGLRPYYAGLREAFGEAEFEAALPFLKRLRTWLDDNR